MSETENVTETNDTSPGGNPPPEAEQTEHPSGPGREAAKYRTQRNEAREQLAATQATIAKLQAAEVARVAGDRLANAADLFEVGQADLSQFVTPEGYVDRHAVEDAVEDLLAGRPGLARSARQPAVDRYQGHGNGSASPKPELGDIFKL